jgi:hypothetical protein
VAHQISGGHAGAVESRLHTREIAQLSLVLDCFGGQETRDQVELQTDRVLALAALTHLGTEM